MNNVPELRGERDKDDAGKHPDPPGPPPSKPPTPSIQPRTPGAPSGDVWINVPVQPKSPRHQPVDKPDKTPDGNL